MSLDEKNALLDTLAAPGGFCYEARQDIFSTTPDAPQKLFGYNSFYDLSAPYLNMVFDYETIYFNYNSRTWLVEIWKGQYGINCKAGKSLSRFRCPLSKLYHAAQLSGKL